MYAAVYVYICVRACVANTGRVSRFRKRYSGEYEGMSTAELSRDLRRDVEHYRGLWRTAKTADAKVPTTVYHLDHL